MGVYFTALYRALASSRTRLLDHTQRLTKTPLNEWSVRRRTSTWQHTTLTTDIHATGGIRTHDRSGRAVVDLRLTARLLGPAVGVITVHKYITQWTVCYVAASGLTRSIYSDLGRRDLSREEMPGASGLLKRSTITALQLSALCTHLKIIGLCKLGSTEDSFHIQFLSISSITDMHWAPSMNLLTYFIWLRREDTRTL